MILWNLGSPTKGVSLSSSPPSLPLSLPSLLPSPYLKEGLALYSSFMGDSSTQEALFRSSSLQVSIPPDPAQNHTSLLPSCQTLVTFKVAAVGT